MVFMNTEYSRLPCLRLRRASFGLCLGIITAISFAVGALASGLTGYLGMFSATKANVEQPPLPNRKDKPVR